ncbi:hypothetical protein F4801DRAFT_4311 [Xylaria longipes]|nr:hypothetical protein F4801DRAFT_4311 [Xylaria longipes]
MNNNALIAGGFAFTDAYNPNLPDYDPALVEAHFQQSSPRRAHELLAWRQHFYPGESRCARCLILRLDCDISDSNGSCSNCIISQSQCRIIGSGSPSNDPFLPDLSGNQTPGHIPDESLPVIENYPTVPDFHGSPNNRSQGSTSDNNHQVIEDHPTVPDSQGSPDNNVSGIIPEIPDPNSLSPSTYIDPFLFVPSPPPQNPDIQNPQNIMSPSTYIDPSVFLQPPSPQNPNPRGPQNIVSPFPPPAFLQDPVRPPTYLPPLLPFLNPSIPNNYYDPTSPSAYLGTKQPVPPQPTPQPEPEPEPAPVFVPPPHIPQLGQYPADDVDPYQGIRPVKKVPKDRCHLCFSFGRKHRNWANCNWNVDPNNKRHHGCSLCRRWGLVCVVGNVALPPHPADKINIGLPPNCEDCAKYNTNCDRQRPCDSCVGRGNHLACRERDEVVVRATFPRGTAFGCELYPYISAMKGGPDGINSIAKYNGLIDQPGDFHLQYINWINGGPLPFPDGHALPTRIPPRPVLTLRSLPIALPSPRVPGRGLPRVSRHPRKDSTKQLIQSTRPVFIPLNDRQLLGGLAGPQGDATIMNVATQPLQAPPSPGPTVTLFETDNPIIPANLSLPVGHPERINQALLAFFPQPPHPNPTNTPALQTVPALRQPQGQPGVQPLPPCMELKIGQDGVKNLCRQPSIGVCLDVSHGNPPLVCDECNVASRTIIMQALAPIAQLMRAYACSDCAIRAASDPGQFRGGRFNVWGLPPNAFDDPVGLPQPRADPNPSRSLGQPLRITGCSCALKLIDPILCTPHRLHHFLEVRNMADSMRNFVLRTFGRMVCPFCLVRSGADAYNFVDEQGVPHPVVAYSCMACLGIIVAEPATLALINDPAGL